jgi:hypothetical protein
MIEVPILWASLAHFYEVCTPNILTFGDIAKDFWVLEDDVDGRTNPLAILKREMFANMIDEIRHICFWRRSD